MDKKVRSTSDKEMQLCYISICRDMHLETQVGPLANQLNVSVNLYQYHITIIFEQLSFRILSVVLFSLKGGVMLVRQKAPTQIIVE